MTISYPFPPPPSPHTHETTLRVTMLYNECSEGIRVIVKRTKMNWANGKIKTREILADDAILYATHWQPRQT